jgi:hypothetical protein
VWKADSGGYVADVAEHTGYPSRQIPTALTISSSVITL